MRCMTQRRGRPRKAATKLRIEPLVVRLQTDEKQAFNEAADAAGMQLSPWVRDRLRSAAKKELEAIGKQPAFVKGGA